MQDVQDYLPNYLLVYDETLLQQNKGLSDTDDDKQFVWSVINDTDRALLMSKPWTTTSNEALDPERNPKVISNFFDYSGETLDNGEIFRGMATWLGVSLIIVSKRNKQYPSLMAGVQTRQPPCEQRSSMQICRTESCSRAMAIQLEVPSWGYGTLP